MTNPAIALLGESVLRQIAQPIDDVTRVEIQQLAQTMLHILEGSAGVGLAATFWGYNGSTFG